MEKKKKVLNTIFLLGLSTSAVAMEALDDQSLAQTTGQDGINIGINVSKIQMSQLAVIDRDGFGTTANDANKASLVLSGVSASSVVNQNFNVNFLGASDTSATLKMMMDIDGGNTKPFANIAISFGNNITGIKISPFALYIAGASSSSGPSAFKSIFTGTSQNSDVIKLLQMDNGLDISFGAIKPTINLQLGNMPQNRMVVLSGAIQSICGTGIGCPVTFVSENSDIGASFNFQLKANDLVNGFSLNGFYVGLEPTGMIFGNTGESSKFDLGINQLTMGKSGESVATSFDGLKNGSMGNLGVVGASVTNLKMKVSGL